MHTSITLVALMGLLPTRASVDNPTWLSDYGQARKLGQSERKPLAVFVGSGPQGFEKVLGDGLLSPQARRLLADRYVCVYVDTATEAGRRVAGDFTIQSTGLVISDRSGDYQAFHFRGTLTDDELTRCLRRFSDPNYVVRSTVNSPNEERVSYYLPQSGAGTTSPGVTTYPNYPTYPSYSNFAPAGFGGGRNC